MTVSTALQAGLSLLVFSVFLSLSIVFVGGVINGVNKHRQAKPVDKVERIRR